MSALIYVPVEPSSVEVACVNMSGVPVLCWGQVAHGAARTPGQGASRDVTWKMS